MRINDFDFMGAVFAPGKTDSPLIVDADAVLSFAATFQCFKLITRRNFKRV